MPHIPDTDTAELTEVIRFRATPAVKIAAEHIAVDARSSDQNTYLHLLSLGIEAFHERETTKAS